MPCSFKGISETRQAFSVRLLTLIYPLVCSRLLRLDQSMHMPAKQLQSALRRADRDVNHLARLPSGHQAHRLSRPSRSPPTVLPGQGFSWPPRSVFHILLWRILLDSHHAGSKPENMGVRSLSCLPSKGLKVGDPNPGEESMVWVRPFPPPGTPWRGRCCHRLRTTCKRCGRSFSFSIISAMARAKISEPPPGPVCTTPSIGFVGLNDCAGSGAANANARKIALSEHMLRSIGSPYWLFTVIRIKLLHRPFSSATVSPFARAASI